jgi:hypothetical protein
MKPGQYEKTRDIINRLVQPIKEDVIDLDVQLATVPGSFNKAIVADREGKIVADTYWIDYLVPLVSTRVGSNSKPDFDFTNVGYLFPQNDATEILYMVLQMPHGYKEGSTIYPHVHYRRTAAAKPVFKIDYAWFNIGEAQPAFATYVMDQDAIEYESGSIQQIAKGASGITGTGEKISSLMLVKLYRDDNVVTGDVLAWQFDVHIECDSYGSELEYIK